MPLALHEVAPHRRRVQQHIHHMVVQQVHLVYVQDAAMRRRQQARLEASTALAYRRLDVQRSDDRLFSRAHRQLHKAHLPRAPRTRRRSPAQKSHPAKGASGSQL